MREREDTAMSKHPLAPWHPAAGILRCLAGASAEDLKDPRPLLRQRDTSWSPPFPTAGSACSMDAGGPRSRNRGQWTPCPGETTCMGWNLDPRCVDLAAFALALAAWTYPGAEGYRPLAGVKPRLLRACAATRQRNSGPRCSERTAAAGGMPVERDLFDVDDNLAGDGAASP